jgi:hypothetical protein
MRVTGGEHEARIACGETGGAMTPMIVYLFVRPVMPPKARRKASNETFAAAAELCAAGSGRAENVRGALRREVS